MFRIALHFNSPRVRGGDITDLYHLLRQTRVYATAGISSELRIDHMEPPVVRTRKGELHISEMDGIFKIYVPRDPKAQDFCYHSILPRELLKCIMEHGQIDGLDPRATCVIGAILNAPTANASQILDMEGIAEASVPDVPDYESETDDDEEYFDSSTQYADAVTPKRESRWRDSGIAVSPSPLSSAHSLTPQQLLSTPTPFRRQSIWTPRSSQSSLFNPATPILFSPPLQSGESFGFESPACSDQPSPTPSKAAIPEGDDAARYRETLDNVIAAARNRSYPALGLESKASGYFDGIPSPGSFPIGDVTSRAKHEKENRIGAAGELFVREPISVVVIC